MNILNDEYLPPLSSGLVVGSSTVGAADQNNMKLLSL